MGLAHIIDDVQRTQDVQVPHDITFDTMMLSSNTLQGLKESGFYKPSPIQLHGIPLGKCGFDLLLEAKSGTGKTAVFSVITLEKINLSKGVQSVILAPTREIAAQICDVIRKIGSKYEGLEVEVVIGGLPIQEDVAKLKKAIHVVVGSPGRLRHLIQSEYLDVSAVRLLVLDEADKLMEKSFQTDINYIFSVLPKQKQVIMSSATYPDEAKSFINKYVQNAQHICPDSNSVLLGVAQKVSIVVYNINIVKQTKSRFQELLRILPKKQFKQCLVFCNYQARVAELYKLLKREKWPAEQLYGQQEQTDRLEALKTLQEYRCRILISTDLAARGIDASNVDLIINFEPPSDWQTYLHRIGRAGRFGSHGTAITILSEGKEQQKFVDMLKPLKLSLNLNYFWTEKVFIIDKTCQLIVSPPPAETLSQETSNIKNVNKNYKDLWNTLFFKKIKDNTQMDSFDGLLKSFEEFEGTKMETFSELLDSFENFSQNDSTEESTVKPHKKFPNIPIREYLDFMNNIRNENEHSLNKLLEISNSYESNEENYMKKTTNLKTVNFGQRSSKELEKITSNSEKIDNLCEAICQNNNDVNNINTDNCINDLTDIRQELQDAGLPTSFCSSKDKHSVHKSNRKNSKSANSLITHIKLRQIDRAKSKNCSETGNVDRSKTVTLNKNIDHYLSQNSKLILKLTNDTNTSQIHCNDKQDFKTYKVTRRYNNQPGDCLSRNYINWYEQLKLRAQQIELTVYLNEISKF